MADTQNEMQTLRNRLTLAETKLVEKDLEIRNFGGAKHDASRHHRKGSAVICLPRPNQKTTAVSFVTFLHFGRKRLTNFMR